MHPALQIYIWTLLVLATQILQEKTLILLAVVAILTSLRIDSARLMTLLRRTRWIFFSILLIYAYTGSGDVVWPQWGALSPVSEGVIQGLFQLLRLFTVLAGLSILLALLPQAQLMEGLYFLAAPLKFLGLSRERFAVRLALTLRYAENEVRYSADNWLHGFEHLLASQTVKPECIEMHVVPFSRRDWLLFVFASAVIIGVCL